MRSGIVLAGGRSSRFGRDKLAESIDGDALLDRAIAVLAVVTDEVIVAGRTVDQGDPKVRCVPDAEPFGGPLVALDGALREARGTAAVVVGGDMPGLVPAVLQSMLDRLESESSVDALILAPGSTGDAPRQLLPMALRVREGAGAAGAALATGRRALHSLLDQLRWAELPRSVWLPLDPGASTLLDVDTPADLERIRSGKGR